MYTINQRLSETFLRFRNRFPTQFYNNTSDFPKWFQPIRTLPTAYKAASKFKLWRACNLTSFSPCLTGPVDYPFASCHKCPGFKYPGGYLCETGILLLALSRYNLKNFIFPKAYLLHCSKKVVFDLKPWRHLKKFKTRRGSYSGIVLHIHLCQKTELNLAGQSL